MEDGLVLDNDTNKVIAKYPVLILVVMEDGLVQVFEVKVYRL